MVLCAISAVVAKPLVRPEHTHQTHHIPKVIEDRLQERERVLLQGVKKGMFLQANAKQNKNKLPIPKPVAANVDANADEAKSKEEQKNQEAAQKQEAEAKTGKSNMPPPAPAKDEIKYIPMPTKAKLQEHKSPTGKPPHLKAYVMNIATQQDRLSDYMGWWRSAWPELEIDVVTAIVEEKRGLGILKTFIKALNKAIDDNVEVAMFMEDDAKPFEDVKWPADFYAAYDNLPKEASIMLLGGHHVRATTKPNFDTLLTQVTQSYGAFAFMVRRPQLFRLRDFWFDLAQKTTLESYSCDEAWHELWTNEAPAFITTPLLVDHYGIYSNTWGKLRSEVISGGDPWMGKRDWWNFPSEFTSDIHPAQLDAKPLN